MNAKAKKIVNFDSHMIILNFLIHIQQSGFITENQRMIYSDQIQSFLKEREYRIDFLNKILDEL